MPTDKLIDLISSILEISPSIVNENLSSESCPNWDSMNHLQLILALEEVYNIKIEDDDALNLLSYKEIKDFISTKSQ